MYFDLRSCDSAYKFVLDFMRMTPDEFITERVINCECEFEHLWTRNITRIQEVDISQLRIMGFHILGSLNGCEEIKKNGLWSLKKVLSNDTRLSYLLKEQGIYIDISNKMLHVGAKQYDMDY